PSDYTPPEQAPSDNTKPPQTDFDKAYEAAVQKELGGNSKKVVNLDLGAKAVNPDSGALGTFQLMPDQLPKGMSKDQFLAMSPDEQKQVFLNSYLPAHKLSRETLNPADVGLAIGAPAAIGQP